LPFRAWKPIVPSRVSSFFPDSCHTRTLSCVYSDVAVGVFGGGGVFETSFPSLNEPVSRRIQTCCTVVYPWRRGPFFHGQPAFFGIFPCETRVIGHRMDLGLVGSNIEIVSWQDGIRPAARAQPAQSSSSRYRPDIVQIVIDDAYGVTVCR